MVWDSLCLELYSNKTSYFYVGSKEILKIEKKNLNYVEQAILSKVKVIKNLPKSAKKLGEEGDWAGWWVYKHYFGKRIFDGTVGITDLGIKEEYYEKKEFIDIFLYYRSKKITVDKRIPNELSLEYASAKVDSAFRLLDGYLSYLNEINEKFFFDGMEEVKDEIDFLTMMRKKNKITIMLSNEAYETLRAVRVELSMYPFEKDRPEDD
jgi:hypothetical protein